jgi:site-specific DNA-methyltransferase (adenine-specific)
MRNVYPKKRGDRGVRKEVIGNATLYLGDCLEVLPSLADVDAVITDPPYGIGAGSASFASGTRKKSPIYAFGDWDKQSASVKPWLDVGRYHLFWGGQYFADQLPVFDGWLAWVKRPIDCDFSKDSRSYANIELAWRDWGKARFIAHVWDGGMRAGEAENRTFCHPSQKPVEVMRWCLDQLPDDAHTVCDPFMGSGTTGVACLQMGKRFIGIEIEPNYFDIACERIENAQRQERLFA